MSASAVDFPIPNILENRWRHALIALVLSLAWIALLYRDSATSMVVIWSRSETFMHGFLVIPIVFWLVWRKRLSIASHMPDPLIPALPIVAFAGLAWALGELAFTNSLTQLTFVALLVLAVPCVLGGSIARIIVFPLGFMFFSVPLGEFLLPKLMEWTADFTVIGLRLSGVPVYREGLNFVIPSGNWSVVEACSGVRYLIASLTVGSIFAYLNYRSVKRRAMFVLVSVFVPLLANWIRAYMIVMLGHLSGNTIAVGVDHLIYGWIFFGVVIFLMFAIGAHWSEPEQLVIFSTEPEFFRVKNAATVVKLWGATAIFAVLVALPHIALWFIDRSPSTAVVPLTEPTTIGSHWKIARPTAFDFTPAYQNSTEKIHASYVHQGQTVGLYIGFYRKQDYKHKLVASDNVLVVRHDPRWALASSGERVIAFAHDLHAVHATELRGASLTESDLTANLLVWKIYWINGTLTASDYLARVYGAIYRLMGRGDDSAVIVVYTPKGRGAEGDVKLESFLSDGYATINEFLLRASNRN
ncbi:MAG: exosortase A [Rhodoferax sp.]|nr:exosortase A [Rhodoferax sp.]MDP3652882.1 exosortase A [Rhodoferax sp.]